MQLVEEVEEALFGAVVAHNEKALAMQQTGMLLSAAKAAWLAKKARQDADAVATLAMKRRFYAGSTNAVHIQTQAQINHKCAPDGAHLLLGGEDQEV